MNPGLVSSPKYLPWHRGVRYFLQETWRRPVCRPQGCLVQIQCRSPLLRALVTLWLFKKAKSSSPLMRNLQGRQWGEHPACFLPPRPKNPCAGQGGLTMSCQIQCHRPIPSAASGSGGSARSSGRENLYSAAQRPRSRGGAGLKGGSPTPPELCPPPKIKKEKSPSLTSSSLDWITARLAPRSWQSARLEVWFFSMSEK